MRTVALPGGIEIPLKGALRSQRLAEIIFCAGAGLLLCSLANALSRATDSPPSLLYWGGLLVLSLPIFYRLTSEDATPAERLALVCLLGLSLYGVKLVRDAPIFTFSDELIHAFNSNEVSQHHHLFHANPILAISRFYPGLEGATSALRSLTGMSSFGAGAIVVGAARLTMMSAMFLVFWRVSHSPRAAGIGTAIFTGNFNYLFWSAQYSYESLALPLLMVVILAVVEIGRGSRAARRPWQLLACLVIAAIVITHHITSYAVVAILSLLSLLTALSPRRPKPTNPWPLALVAIVLTLCWLLVVASATVGYLSPVIGGAITSTLHTAAGEAPARGLFQGTTVIVEPTPLPARAAALLAVLVLALGLPFGLRVVWRRYRDQPIAVLFGLASVGFFAALALRLAPEAWETGNRASEFLFIGLAFVLGCVGLERWRPRLVPWLGRALVAAALTLVLMGGIITGWPWDSQLALPVRAEADGGGTIHSPPLGLAEWARTEVPGRSFAALTADARLLLAPGEKFTLGDFTADIVNVIPARELEPWMVPQLRRQGVRYLVADQRLIGNDGTRGYYFSLKDSQTDALLPRAAVTKFGAAPGVSRIFDSGSIIVYDLDGGPARAAAQRRTAP